MKRLVTVFTISLFLLTSFTAAAQQVSMSELARKVREAASGESRANKARIDRFTRERAQQQRLLQEAKQALTAEERRSDALSAEHAENEKQLAELDTVLQERLGNLGELFGIVRQSAGDVQALLDNSMVSAQHADRSQFLANIAQSKELPTMIELKQLWSAMVTEIEESGKVAKFNANILKADGTNESAEVVRVGVFNAISDGQFLSWNDDVKSLVELPKQPASRWVSLAGDMQSAAPGSLTTMAVDFTRGNILAAETQKKTVAERLGIGEDGLGDAGPVGYVIIGVAIFGILLCLWKWFSLFTKGGAMRRQLKNDTPNKNNPLGRVMSVYADNPDTDIETLELKLDEAILRETAPLESGLSFIKVLYVVAPLLGLLGTVVGMIETFQQITLFGTGDPRRMAGGISQALMTTVLGLVAAIPLTLLHSYLQGKSKSLIQVLEEQAAGIIARLAERR